MQLPKWDGKPRWVGEPRDDSIEQLVSKLFELEEEAWNTDHVDRFRAKTSNGLKITIERKYDKHTWSADGQLMVDVSNYTLFADDMTIAKTTVEGWMLIKGYSGIKQLYDHVNIIANRISMEKSKKQAEELRQRRKDALGRF